MKGKRIVIGITGSIAAYKIPFLIRLLIREGAEVQVIMTPSATDFVTPLTLSTLSQKPVIVEPFDAGNGQWSNHVELGRWADAYVIAPVTANTLGKMAHGIADNFLVTAYLSAKCPVFIAPAMDLDMYRHPSTKNNIEILRGFGNNIIEPQTGELASGLTGPGRMEEPEQILQVLKEHFSSPKPLHKKKVLVTAGPTYEPIDPVRFIGNYSTGTMGFELAREASRLGGTVTLVTGPSFLELEASGVSVIRVNTAAEMLEECEKRIHDAHFFIMAAAVADYTPATLSANKIKKESQNLELKLHPTTDILKTLGENKRKDQIFAGFALETDSEIENARKKLVSKNLDFIILNSLRDPGAGFGTSTNRVTILDKTGILHSGTLKEKKEVARDILQVIIGKSKSNKTK